MNEVALPLASIIERFQEFRLPSEEFDRLDCAEDICENSDTLASDDRDLEIRECTCLVGEGGARGNCPVRFRL